MLGIGIREMGLFHLQTATSITELWWQISPESGIKTARDPNAFLWLWHPHSASKGKNQANACKVSSQDSQAKQRLRNVCEHGQSLRVEQMTRLGLLDRKACAGGCRADGASIHAFAKPFGWLYPNVAILTFAADSRATDLLI